MFSDISNLELRLSNRRNIVMTLTFTQVCTVSTSSLQICYSRLRRVKSVDFRNKLFMSNRSTCLLFFFKNSSYFIVLGLSRRQFFSTGHEIVKKRPRHNMMPSFLKHNTLYFCPVHLVFKVF